MNATGTGPLALIIIAVISSSTALCNDWPCWRGPNANSVADGRELPIRWSKTENVHWSVKLPGWGTA